MCYESLSKLATLRNILGGLAVTVVLLAVMGIWLTPEMQAISGGLTILDMRIGYTTSDVLELFTALGSEGLALYSILQVIDMLFPLTYASTMTFAMIYLSPDLLKEKRFTKIVFFFPLIAAAFDYLENVLIATQIAAFPALSELAIVVASTVTWLKWMFLFMAFILLIIFLILAMSPSKVKPKNQ